MCIPIMAAAVIGSALLGAGVAVTQGAKARKQARTTQQQNVNMAQEQAKRAENQYNRLNQKQPGIAALWQQNLQGAQRGLGSTFLTGTKGASASPYLGGSPSVLGA